MEWILILGILYYVFRSEKDTLGDILKWVIVLPFWFIVFFIIYLFSNIG